MPRNKKAPDSQTLQKSLQKTSSDDAPVKVKNLILTPSGTWAFRMAVPHDIRATLPRELPSEMGSGNIYVGLGNDKKQAAISALALTAKWKGEIYNERRRLEGKKEVTLVGDTVRRRRRFRPLSDVPREEVINLIKRYFIDLELRDTKERNSIVIMSVEEKNDWRENLEMEMATRQQEIAQGFEHVRNNIGRFFT